MNRPAIELELEQVVAEDLDYLSELVQQVQITNAEIRRSSVALRRLICENYLQRVASARRHTLTIPIPETRELIHSLNADADVIFFQLGGYKALGVDVSCSMLERRAQTAPRPFDPSLTYEARLETYKRQPVFMIRAVLELATESRPSVSTSGAVTRESVIKYVANKTGGAHYDARRATKEEELLDIARRAASATSSNGVPTFMISPQVLENPLLRAKTPLPGIGPEALNHLDPVLLELLGSARFLVESPAVQSLRDQL